MIWLTVAQIRLRLPLAVDDPSATATAIATVVVAVGADAHRVRREPTAGALDTTFRRACTLHGTGALHTVSRRSGSWAAQSSKGTQGLVYVTQFGPRDEPSADGLLRCLAEEIGSYGLPSAVVQGATRICGRRCAKPGEIVWWDGRVVKYDPGRDPQSTVSPGLRQGQMHFRGARIRKFVKGQRSLVRNHASLIRPQPCGYQILVLARGEVDEPVNTPACPRDPPSADVLYQKLG